MSHSRLFTRLVCLVVAFGAATTLSCQPEGGEDPSQVKPTGTPLPQVSVVPIQAWTGAEWLTIHPSQLGIERLAQTWCNHQRTLIEDNKVCGPEVYRAVQQTPGIAELPQAGTDFALCTVALCGQRNEVCAGYMLEELGRSPLQRELDAATFDGLIGGTPLPRLSFNPGVDGLQLPQSEIDALSGTSLPDGLPRRLRFQPLAAEGRAAAFRGSLNRLRDAGRWAHELRSFPVNGQTCLQRFQARDVEGDPDLLPPLDPNPDGTRPSWTDLYVATFMDGANEFTEVLPRTIASIRDAAAQVLNGVAAPPDAVATQWNGKVNSAVAAANVVAYGDTEPIPLAQGMAAGCSSDSHPAAEIGPTGVPVCPPVSLNKGVNLAKKLMEHLEVPPSGDTAALIKFAAAYFEKKKELGLPVDSNTDPSVMLKAEGITEKDVIAADLYKCQENKKFGVFVLPASGTGGKKYFGTQPPATALPGGVLSAHFFGAPKQEANLELTSAAYAGAGAFAALDQMQSTGSAIKQELVVGATDQKVVVSLTNLLKGFEKKLGGRRLEFLIGKALQDDPAHVDRVQVLIHGVPASDEKFWAVQGLDGIKCVLGGTIDGKPCKPEEYKHEITASVTALDPRMLDLKGGTVSEVLTSLPKPNEPEAKISVVDAIYIVRINGDYARAFGGAVPSPVVGGFLPNLQPYVPNGALYTRRIMAPAGGTQDQVLEDVLSANVNDCSQPQTTCAGLPKTLWPPLENEIAADPGANQIERSWEIYLDRARLAADEADALGEKLLESGLKIDQRSEEAQRQLIELCGADGAEGCAEGGVLGGDTVEWAAMGDKHACLWEVGGVICGCPVTVAPGKLCPQFVKESCPLLLAKNEELPKDKTQAQAYCTGRIEKRLSGQGSLLPFKPIPVRERLAIAQVEDLPANECSLFAKLRNQEGGNDRLNDIRELSQTWGQIDITSITEELKYEEGFADNFKLTYQGNVVFDTARNGRPSSNSNARHPCYFPDEEKTSGSTFWDREVQCFVSGVTCPPPPGVGHDGCPGSWGQDADKLSLDTEPAALRNRWAWGFGHLRRSMAVLGVLTGKLEGTMAVAEWIPGISDYDQQTSTDNYASVNFRLSSKSCVQPDDTTLNPDWARDCGSGVRCVDLADPGVESDTARYDAGRPVNANAWLSNRRATYWWRNPPTVGPSETSTGNFLSPAGQFPCTFDSGAGACKYNGGVDPQMVYCSLPKADTLLGKYESWQSAGIPSGPLPRFTSAFVGGAAIGDVVLKDTSSDWKTARNEMWSTDFGDDFCTNPSLPVGLKSAVWHAFCHAVPADPDWQTLQKNAAFMTKGEMPDPGQVYADRDKVGPWLLPYVAQGTSWETKWAQLMLFDLTSSAQGGMPGYAGGSKMRFQYPITRRNIYDALELACHARSQPAGQVKCEEIDSGFDYRKNLLKAAGVVKCLQNKVATVASRVVVGPVPKLLLKDYKSGKPLAFTGHGGMYLEAMSEQYAALTEIDTSFRHIAEAYGQVALVLQKLDAIERKTGKKVDQLDNAKIAALLSSLAEASRDFGQAGDFVDALKSFGTKNWASVQAGVLTLASAHFEMESIDDAISVAKLEGLIEVINATQEALSVLSGAQDAAANIPVQVNKFIVAAEKLRTIQKQAEILKAQVALLEYAGPNGQDPQYVNTAMRRIYNTNLVRYENALDRARKQAFIARRAIELRFGVDLERMTEEMPLVSAPSTWANDVCTMTGIDYAKIREPDPDKKNEAFKFGEPPPEDEEFSTQYVGEYVRKLEDFVSSYSLKYPLKESDDTAVISLADDIARVRAKCLIPSTNRLYYSAEFDTRNTEAVDADTRGWFVDGCNLSVEDPNTKSSVAWRGCVVPEPAYQDKDINVNLPVDSHPLGGLPYRLGNRPCMKTVGANGQVTVCPDTSTYVARGSLRQRLDGLSPGYYVVSLHTYPDSKAAPYADGNGAELRVVRESDEAVIASESITPTSTGWARHYATFEAVAGQSYHLDIVPSTKEVALDGSSSAGPGSWPGLVVSAAQVEKVALTSKGAFPPPAAWERTDLSRTIVDYACKQPAGYELRKLFKRRCEYVCADGINTVCAKIDDNSMPTVCFYEANFQIPLEAIEIGSLIPTGQIAIGNFNYRHNRMGVNVTGTGVTNCENSPGTSCYGNGFLEYTLIHSGTTGIRNWEGGTLPVTMGQAYIEHGKALAAEKTITNPPSASDTSLIEPYMKSEYEGRPLTGLYTLRIWDRPELRWERVEDIQLIWRYHYWTRFEK